MLSLPSTITLAVVMCIVFNCVVCDNTMEGIDAKFAAEEPKNDIERFARSSPLRWGKRAPGKDILRWGKRDEDDLLDDEEALARLILERHQQYLQNRPVREAPLRWGKRSFLDDKRAPLRWGKRAPSRFGKRLLEDDESEFSGLY